MLQDMWKNMLQDMWKNMLQDMWKNMLQALGFLLTVGSFVGLLSTCAHAHTHNQAYTATNSTERGGAFATRDARINLLSFDGVGKDVAMGMAFQMPFLRMPTKSATDKSGQQSALVNINTGAVVTTTLVAGFGILAGHLIRSMGLAMPATNKSRSQADTPSTKHKGHLEGRSDAEIEPGYAKLFDTLKMVYTNESGEKNEVTLSELFNKTEHLFLEHEIDLPACMEKSVCTLIYKSGENMRLGRATGTEKIIDGILNFDWLSGMLRHSVLGQAIAAGKLTSDLYSHCDVKYPRCKWAAPDEKLMELLQTYVRLN